MSTWRSKLTALLLGALTMPAFGAGTATTTSLTVGPSASVAAGTVVTLTATVANPSPVAHGTVLFCNAAVAYCENSALLGSMQLNGSGTATLKTRLGVGSYQLKALFVATTANAASSSAEESLAVTANASYLSSISLQESGSAGSYTLSGTLYGYGSGVLTGSSLNYEDSSNGNAVIGSATVGTSHIQLSSYIAATPGGTVRYNTAVGDVNNDGIPDLVAAYYSGPSVSVSLGNGDGTFQTPVSYTTDTQPAWVALGDFNGDGYLDIVTADASANTVDVLLNNGNGTFGAKSSYPVPGNPTCVATGDFNGDGILDLAACDTQNGYVAVLLGNGDGTFQNQVLYRTGNSSQVAIADFNRDGIPDIAAVGTSLSILLGNGDGTFQTVVEYATGATGNSVAVGDLNGDGIPDVIVGCNSGKNISVMLANGNGTFQSQVSYSVGYAVNGVAIGDVTGDGIPDILDTSTYSLRVWPGNGDGSFQSATSYNAATSSPFAMTIADLNGDGLLDVVESEFIGSTISVFMGEEAATFATSGIGIIGTAGAQNVVAVFGGDTTHAGTQSNTVQLTESKLVPTVTLTGSPNPATFGGTVTLTATLTGADSFQPTGNVAFKYGSTTLGTSTIAGTVATLSTSVLPVGTDSLTAVYAGDGNFATTTSTALSETVSKSSVAVLVSSSKDPSSYGDLITLSASLTGSGAVPTGTVTFTDGGTTVGTGTLNDAGVCSVSVSTLGAGSHSLTATYSGDPNFY